MTSEVADKPHCHCGSTSHQLGPSRFVCDTCEQFTEFCENCKLGASDEAKKKASGLSK
jgi:hypothetical protein